MCILPRVKLPYGLKCHEDGSNCKFIKWTKFPKVAAVKGVIHGNGANTSHLFVAGTPI